MIFPHTRTLCSLVVLFLSLLPAVGHAQGFLIPENPDSELWRRTRTAPPPTTYRVDRIQVDAAIQEQVATVSVAQTFRNTCSQPLQVRFCFPLPYDGAVDQMTFLVDQQEWPGRLIKADDARRQFANYVRRLQDPALVQWMGTGMFQTQVFPVPAGGQRTVTLRYTQLLRRTGELTDWIVPLQPAATRGTEVGEVQIEARLHSKTPLANIYSPTHEVEVERPDQQTAKISMTKSGGSIRGDFRLLWDHGEQPVRMSMVGFRDDLEEDGYFMLILQPDLPAIDEEKDENGKQIVLVIDKSGSMSGEKIDQVRQAASNLLGKLRPRDQFELITYDNDVESYANGLTKAKRETVKDAQAYVASMLAGGGTNIHDALQNALKTAAKADGRPYVVFLTDGRPTVGVTEPGKIVNAAVETNSAEARVLSLGVGHDVNSRLLDKMSASLQGQSIYVRPGESIDLHVKRLYARIGAPALSDVELEITVGDKPGGVRRLYPRDLVDLFSGDQVIVVGRYRRGGDVEIRLNGNLNGEPQEFKYRAALPTEATGHRNAFVERLWAIRRVGAIIDEIDLQGESDELVEELISISKKHGILTPYTAFLADEEVGLNDRLAQRRQADISLQDLRAETGSGAFRQRAFKGELKGASRSADAEKSLEAFGGLGGFGGGGRQGAPAASSIGGQPAEALSLSTRSGESGSPAIQATPVPRPSLQQARATTRDAIRAIAGKTFYHRQGIWVDSSANEKQIAEAEPIKWFSEAYFELLDKLNQDQKAWLAENESVVLVVKGKSYRVERE